ncbi:MAG: prepilin peptidase [Alphaproteobacteria bacterium]|nr:prepilin peptidase [Alphaproteobacteria bacterium]
MILAVVFGFLFGLFVPYMARRFAKFMPATPAYALWQIFAHGKRAKGYKNKKLRKSFYWRSVMFGLATALISAVLVYKFGENGIGWVLAYVWILTLLAEIDGRMCLLPDILTVPLLILGFAFATLGNGWVVAAESALGALVGYVLPVLLSLMLVKKNKDAFGGGDIKLLAALGAWQGVEPLFWTIAVASVLLLVYVLIRKQRAAPFGPALAASAMLVVFWFF